jgi:hypothetical protein
MGLGDRDTALRILNLAAGWRLVLKSTLPVLGGAHSWSGRFGEEKNVVLLSEFEPRIVQFVA